MGRGLVHAAWVGWLLFELRDTLVGASADGTENGSLYVLQTTNSPPGRRPRVEIDQNTDLSLVSNTPQI